MTSPNIKEAKSRNLGIEPLSTQVYWGFFSAPYVRVLQLGPTGRVVKKKKTGAQHGTREPVFNETLNFELDLQQGGNTRNSRLYL